MLAAVVQIDPLLFAKGENEAKIVARLEEAAGRGARLVVFPECALTGYVFDSLAEALPYAESVPGPFTERLQAHCRRLGAWAIVGMVERVGQQVYNTAVLVGSEGVALRYRKTHLPPEGIDRFATPGNDLEMVAATTEACIGLLICYDLRFPEAVRVPVLRGAEIVALPTNWPAPSADAAPEFLCRARAHDNHVYLLAADRVGEERGARFLGRSTIVAPDGTVLAEASRDREEILVAEIDPARARDKRVFGKGFTLDLIKDRRPELYRALVTE